MVGRPYDCLANPLGAVRLSFEKAVVELGLDPATFDGKDWGATDLFRDFLVDNGGLSQVPILDPVTIQCLQPNTLVRYRGMIQDMLGNEFYIGVHKDGETWRTNKFTDVSQIPMVSLSDTQIWERRLLYCVPVPGQNSWTESPPEYVTNPCTKFTFPQREKRLREDGAGGDDMDMQDHNFLGSASAKKLVRRNDLRNYADERIFSYLVIKKCNSFHHDISLNSHCLLIGVSPRMHMRMRESGMLSPCPQESVIEGSCSSSSLVPDFDIKCFPCLVKIYDSPESDLKLNDVFEFVGVLTFDTKVAVDKDGSSDELLNGFYEDALVHLPPSKVPRLHCLIHRKLAFHDFLSSSLTLEPKSNLVKGIREALLGHLTSVLGNDGLAAHFMLLHLLSRVHTRVGSVAVGKLSFNLTCFSKESMNVFGSRIKLAVKNLLPFTSCIPLTIDHLNSGSLAPTKDYQTNRLVPGVLQLAEGTHLTIDETLLQTGILNSIGVENARLLKNLLEFQKVDYDFKYYKMEMAADTQVLTLSEGKSNILPADVVLPFCPSSVGASEFVDMESLKVWRWYLATLRSLPHSIDSEMQKVVEDDLVAARQADRSLGSQEFSRWLTMGRLMSMSFGETCLSLEHWRMVKELERLRSERSQ